MGCISYYSYLLRIPDKTREFAGPHGGTRKEEEEGVKNGQEDDEQLF